MAHWSEEQYAEWQIKQKDSPGKGSAEPEKPAKTPALKLSMPDAEDEESVQSAAIRVLERAGFLVLSTVHRYTRQQCPGCKAWLRPQGGYGATPGVPDLLVSHETWPEGLWLGIEMKTLTGPLTAEQELLLALRRIVVARSSTDAYGHADNAAHDVLRCRVPEIDQDRVDAARAKVQKAKESRQIAAARRKRR